MKLLAVVCIAFAALAVSSAGVVPAPLIHYFPEKSVKPEARIIDGDVAKDLAAPYIVSFSISSLAYAHHCAGSIIAKDWILTAGHCIREMEELSTDKSVIGLPVYAGLNDRSNLESAQQRIIDFAFVHKSFDGQVGSDDIALVHVSAPFKFDSSVRSIALPAKSEEFTGQESTLYGWGLDNADANIYAKELRVARSNILSPEQCRDAMPSDAPVSSNMICVNVPACYGDGGSPLTIETDGQGLELVAITSWGYIPCGYENRPTAYTAVAKYVGWIAEVQYAYYILH